MQSEQINELATALCAAQTEFTAIPKDSKNPFFKSNYAGLPVVVETASPILNKHGLSISQHINCLENGTDTMVTYLLHSSGQYLAHEMKLHLGNKDDAQAQGSAITYARRYSYMSVLGLVADDDDDGNAASRDKKVAAKAITEAKQVIKEARGTPAAEKTATGERLSVEGDPRWEAIVRGHAANPSDEFLASLYEKGNKWGKLTSKQLDSGQIAAKDVEHQKNKTKSSGARSNEGAKRIAAAFEGQYEGNSTDPF